MDSDSYENKNESPSAIPESLMRDQLKPAPPILVISEAVVSLARHNTWPLLINNPNKSELAFKTWYFWGENSPNPNDELPVDGGPLGWVQKLGDCPRGVLSDLLLPVGKLEIAW